MHDIIKVDGLAKTYEDFALSGVSLSVPAGCVTGFVGSNGAGKTTTIKSILGLVRPAGGRIVLFGEPVFDADAASGFDEAALARAKANIGVVFDTCPFPRESLGSDVARIGRFSFPTWDNKAFNALLRDFDVDPKKKVGNLSRGMGMKLQLAFALAHAPQLLILDEVTAGLDPVARNETLDVLREFVSDDHHGILISSHITSDLEKLADYVVCIDEGHEVFSCAADDITDKAGVARCKIDQVSAVVESGVFEAGSLRVLSEAYSCTLLVPDRALLARHFPRIACERVSIEEYMMLMLKGERR